MNTERYTLRISDVIEPDQEAVVIDAVEGRVGKTREELSAYFKTTDAIEVAGLLEAEASSLRERLEPFGVTVSVSGPGAGAGEASKESAREAVACPRCGSILESLDWRCPECFYEFPEYEFRDEEE